MSEPKENADPSPSPSGPGLDPASTKAAVAPEGALAPNSPPPDFLAALMGDRRACRGVARALAQKGARTRILCADEDDSNTIRNELREGAGALSDGEFGLVSTLTGRLESDSDLNRLLDGTTGVALLSPVGPEGRTWRPTTHLDDVRSVIEAVTNRRIARVIYLSSVSASLKRPIRCLHEAAEAEKLIEKADCLDFLLRIGPVIGRGDPWLTEIVGKAASSNPFAVVRGYGDTTFQPIHEDDLAACVARCFLAPSKDLRAGIYSLASTPPAHVLELLERAAKYLGRWHKARLHIPLFLLALNVRLKNLLHRDRAWEYADRLGLLRCGLVAEKNDWEALLGPACSPRPLSTALEEAAAALGLAPAPRAS